MEETNTVKRAEFLLYLVECLRVRQYEELAGLEREVNANESDK
jgi:hypothetical protein